MIRLHSTMGSVNGYKVRLFLSILDLEYELVDVDMYGGEHKREPFLSLNPFGQMPALQDGDFTIADSHACLVYLARNHASGTWLPSDAAGEAEVAKWQAKSANEVHHGPWMKRAKIRRPDAITLADEEIDARCDRILALIDARLEKHDWLALEFPTIADISVFGPVSILKTSGYDTDRWPALTRWLERIRRLPRAIDIDGK